MSTTKHPTGYHPSDELHVIMDALTELDFRIHSDYTCEPWTTYEGNGPDPKTDREGYLAVLGLAAASIASMLNANKPIG